MSRVVGSSLKMVKFFSQPFWMLHDVVLFCNIVTPEHAHLFRLRHPTCCNKVVKRRATCCAQQFCAMRFALCCVEMLRAFGQLLHNISQHDTTMLQDLASVWPIARLMCSQIITFEKNFLRPTKDAMRDYRIITKA